MSAVWPLQVFYDGACPLCKRECNHYQQKDRFNRIQWVDISQPDFHAADYGLDSRRVNEVMHARTAEGKVYTELWAFLRIWEALPFSLITTPAKWLFKIPGVIWLLRPLYLTFAKNRYRFTGRCTPESCEIPLRK